MGMYNSYPNNNYPGYFNTRDYDQYSSSRNYNGYYNTPKYPGGYNSDNYPGYINIPSYFKGTVYNPYDYPLPPNYSPGGYGTDCNDGLLPLKDYGPNPFVINIEKAAEENTNFRTALWTGEHLQLTLMSIPVGQDIGFEVHPHSDQFIRIEEGCGFIVMGDKEDCPTFKKEVREDYIAIIPAGTWHNLINIGYNPLKLYSIYAPPVHPHGTIHRTKEEAEGDHNY